MQLILFSKLTQSSLKSIFIPIYMYFYMDIYMDCDHFFNFTAKYLRCLLSFSAIVLVSYIHAYGNLIWINNIFWWHFKSTVSFTTNFFNHLSHLFYLVESWHFLQITIAILPKGSLWKGHIVSCLWLCMIRY